MGDILSNCYHCTNRSSVYARIQLWGAPGSVVAFDNINLNSDLSNIGPVLEDLGTAADLHEIGISYFSWSRPQIQVSLIGGVIMRTKLQRTVQPMGMTSTDSMQMEVLKNVLGAETYLEPYMGEEIEEALRAPVAPFDGSTAGTWSFDGDARTLTVNGEGSFIGLPKSFTGGELQNLDGELPDSRVHTVVRLNSDELYLDISTEAATGDSTYLYVAQQEAVVVGGQTSGSYLGGIRRAALDGNTFSFPADAIEWPSFQNTNGDAFSFENGGEIAIIVMPLMIMA